MQGKRIGIALSGGGIRAAIYHLGVLQYMAEAGHFDRITSISSVSGASLCIGAIFAANGNRWPESRQFLEKVQPAVKQLMLTKDVQDSALLRLPFLPWYWRNRVKLLARMLETKWGITGTLQNLPTRPFWEINCTTFETGRRFRIRRDYMGEHATGYVKNPSLPISHMIAASAAFPVLIGPYSLKTKGLRFTRDKAGLGEEMPAPRAYSLWDGGVFDNLGLAALHKVGGGKLLDSEVDYVIVSNAGAGMHPAKRGRPLKNLKRLLDIAASQAESLRTRDFMYSVAREGNGAYLKISGSAAEYPTTLAAPKEKDFDMIFDCGYRSAIKGL
jgi:NTE family protein